jgi:N-carbamoylputrescine amidase
MPSGFEPTVPGGEHPDGIQFWGQSFLAGPDGMILVKASDNTPPDDPTVLLHTLDLDRIAEQRGGWPFFRDRRVDAYGDITRRFIDAD